MWSVYLLSSGSRTYIGSTTDVTRRLRQHNGELSGGAKSTRGRQWEMVAYISGFPDRSSACRWERILKCRRRGLQPRLIAMVHVSQGECPVNISGRGKNYVPPTGLKFIHNKWNSHNMEMSE